MNETLNVIAGRYSCRAFKKEPIPEALLEQIALAGAQAPSSHNRQPWHIVVVTNPALLEDLEGEVLASLEAQPNQANYNFIMKMGGSVFYGAPCFIVIAMDTRQKSAALDCGIVGENIALAASSLGLGNVFCGFAYHAFHGSRGDEFRARLGFPEGYDFCCSVLVGYPDATKAPHEPDLAKITYLK